MDISSFPRSGRVRKLKISKGSKKMSRDSYRMRRERLYQRNKKHFIIEFFQNLVIAITDNFYFCFHSNARRWKEDKSKPGCGPEVMQTLQILGISSTERDLLYSMFKEIDFHDRDEIYLKAFMTKFHLKSTPFTKKLFALFDNDNSGAVDFLEFVTTLWNLCTFSNEGLKNCLFKLFDSDNSGVLDNYEIIDMLKALWGDRYQTSRVARRVGRKLETYEGKMNVQEFRIFVSKYKSVMQPIEKVRNTFRAKVFGEEYWKRMESRRSSIISQMSREALASAHEESIGGTHNFCVAGGEDECITHKHPAGIKTSHKKKHALRKKKRRKNMKRSESFDRQVNAEKQSMKLLHTVLWTEGVELPVTKVFKWALSSSSIEPVRRQVVVRIEQQADASRHSDESQARVRQRTREENLALERKHALHRIQLVRRHHYAAAEAHEFITQYKVNECRKADKTPPRRMVANKENRPKAKSRFYKDRHAKESKSKKKREKRRKKYAVESNINTNLGRSLTYKVAGTSGRVGKHNRPRSARPTSAKRR